MEVSDVMVHVFRFFGDVKSCGLGGEGIKDLVAG